MTRQPSDMKAWGAVLAVAKDFDKKLVDGWKEDMQNMLLFVSTLPILTSFHNSEPTIVVGGSFLRSFNSLRHRLGQSTSTGFLGPFCTISRPDLPAAILAQAQRRLP